jgi:hypothetical protein
MLHPTGFRKYLPEFFLSYADDISAMIKHNAAAAGSALVEGENVLGRHT